MLEVIFSSVMALEFVKISQIYAENILPKLEIEGDVIIKNLTSSVS